MAPPQFRFTLGRLLVSVAMLAVSLGLMRGVILIVSSSASASGNSSVNSTVTSSGSYGGVMVAVLSVGMVFAFILAWVLGLVAIGHLFDRYWVFIQWGFFAPLWILVILLALHSLFL